MIINSLLVFYLSYLYFKNYWISLLSALFYGTIKSTGDFLAHAYFIPMTLGVTLLLASFISFYKWEKEHSHKYLYYLILILIITAFSYPPSLTFFLGTVSLYLLFGDYRLNEKFKISKKRFLTYLILILFIIISLSLSFVFYLNLERFLTFGAGWTNIKIGLSPMVFFGIIPSVLAFLGVIFLINSNKNKILFFWFLFSIIEVYLFNMKGFTILVPFTRLFMFYLVGVSMLAGVGVFALSNLTNLKLNNKYLGLIITIAIIIPITYYPIIKNPLKTYSILDDEGYNALQFIKENYDKNTIIISDPLMSITVTPVTGNEVGGILGSNIGGGNPKGLTNFFSADCSEKRIIQERYAKKISEDYHGRLNLIFSSEEINCDSLKEVYSQGAYVYEFNL